MPDLSSELRALIKRYGTHVLDDPEGLRATLDDYLDDQLNPGQVNLVVDAVRFGSLERLEALVNQGADPSAALVEVSGALAQQRGGDVESAYWACAVLAHAAGIQSDDVSGLGSDPASTVIPRPAAASSTASPARPAVPATTSGPPQAQPTADDDATRSTGSPVPGDAEHGGPDENVVGVPPPVADGDSADAHQDKTGRRGRWPAVAAATVIVVLAAAVVYLVAKPADNASSNAIPVSDLDEPYPFGHFGGNLSSALRACGNASIPTIDFKVWNCVFDDKYGPYALELTEADAQVRSSGTTLPDIILHPRARTIIAEQPPGPDGQYHAYFMEWVSNGDGARQSSPDSLPGDVVRLTLYDVDPMHAGAAIFVPRDSVNDPLTRERANHLLAAIGPDPDKFPFPKKFENPGWANFIGAQYENNKKSAGCLRAFTSFADEQEHVSCQDGAISAQFGILPEDRLDDARFRYGSSRTAAANCSWSTADATASGEIWLSSGVKGISYLYWQQANHSTQYGVISTKGPDATPLVSYFKRFASGVSVDCS
jgi:hypothetical protein